MPLAYQEHYTVSDYKQWKGEWELFDGMPYAMSPSPGVSHQTTASRFTTLLTNEVDKKTLKCPNCLVLMETDWYVSEDTVVRPDVMLICGKTEEKISKTPMLIVEVVSDSSTKRDEQMKFDLYQKRGVSYYFLAYPEKRTIKVFHNIDSGFDAIGEYTQHSDTFSIGECSLELDFAFVWQR